MKITKIRIDQRNRYRFRFEIIEYAKEIIEFVEIFNNYVQFIDLSTFIFIKFTNYIFLISRNYKFVNFFERKRRRSLTLTKNIFVVKRLKIFIDFFIIRRKSYSDNVCIICRRANNLKTFEIVYSKDIRYL